MTAVGFGGVVAQGGLLRRQRRAARASSSSSASGRSTSSTSWLSVACDGVELATQLLLWSPLVGGADRAWPVSSCCSCCGRCSEPQARMSFHPNDVAAARPHRVVHPRRRVRASCVGAFFRTQVLEHAAVRAAVGDEPAARSAAAGAARHHLRPPRRRSSPRTCPGTRSRFCAPTSDSLRVALRGSSAIITADAGADRGGGARGSAQAPNRPTVILADATFDVVSVLEEHRVEFPGPDHPGGAQALLSGRASGRGVRRLHGRDHGGGAQPAAVSRGYKSGQQIGKGGLERQYEAQLRGKEGTRFVEVDARGRVVGEAGGARRHRARVAGPAATRTSISTCSASRRRCSATRCRAASSRWTRRPAGCSRCTARRASTRTGSSAAFPTQYYSQLRRRPAQAAVQQGDAGRVSARLDVQAGDGDHGAGGAASSSSTTTCRSRARAATSSATATSAAGTRTGTATSTSRRRSRSRATSTSTSSA